MYRQFLACLFCVINLVVSAQYYTDEDTAQVLIDTTEYVEYDEENEYEYEEDTEAFSFTPISEQDSFTTEKRKVKDTTKEKFKNDSDFWYVEKGKEKKKEEQQQDTLLLRFIDALGKLFSEPIMKVLVWVVVILLFIPVVFWIAGLDYAVLLGKDKIDRKQSAEECTDMALMKTDMHPALEAALRENNFRLAVRLMFLISLKNLSDKKILHYTEHKTNAEYVRDMWGTGYYNDFFQLARAFEYVWYGHFEVNAENFARIEQHFRPFKNPDL